MFRMREAVVSFVVGVSLLEAQRREISALSSEWLRHPSPSLIHGNYRETLWQLHYSRLESFARRFMHYVES